MELFPVKSKKKIKKNINLKIYIKKFNILSILSVTFIEIHCY